MSILDRRTLLGSFVGTTLLGSFLVKDPKQLVLPEKREIVLATELPPEPLGHVLFEWAQVQVHRRDGDRWRVRIEGTIDELDRQQAFYLAAEHDERLKIYFTGVP